MLHVHQFGAATGPPLVALHGVQGHGGRWAPLAALGRRVLAPDLAGHGRSPWDPPWTMERFAADVLELLGDVSTFDVVGHSFGGNLGVWIARLEPSRVRRLVLVDPAMGVHPEVAGRLADQAVVPWSFASPQAAAEWAGRTWALATPDLQDAEIEAHLARSEDGRYRFRYRPAAAGAVYSELSREPLVPPPSVPTLILRAPREKVVRRHFLKLCAEGGCDVTVVDIDCGHMMLEERPAEVLDAIRTFLAP